MFYIYAGNDVEAVRTEARAKLRSYVAAGHQAVALEAASFTPGQLYDALESVSLFTAPTTYLLDEPQLNSSFWEECLACRQELAAAESVFIMVAGTVSAAEKKKLQAVATEWVEAKMTKERFDSFAAANAVAAKDKKQAWLIVTEARAAGIVPEELIGIIWWQLKTLLLVTRTASAEEAGSKSYPYQKAKRAAAAFAPGEVERLATTLLQVYHEGHGGERDIWLALESWTLQL